MIFRQIGKSRHIIMNTAHPVQRQRMGRNFHHAMGAAAFHHLGKEGLEFKALGGGTLRRQLHIADHVAHGTNQTNLCADRRFQQVL